MANVVSVKNLHKHFGKLHAVDGINLEIKKSEIVGFLGPNGAGKSTTIRCMMGFNKPTSGKVLIFGHDMEHDPVPAKNKIGYLPGNVKLYDKWTGNDHIKFFESVRGPSKNIKDLISRLDFDPNKKFKNLSSGNRQKLGLILALMNDPNLLIMDEPTVGLDPLLQNEIYQILLEKREAGATIFISSHNLPEVEKLCDRVAIIKQGKLVAIEGINALSEKKLHKIEISLTGKYKPSDFKVEGVEKVEKINGGLLVLVSGDLNPLLKVIAKHKVVNMEMSHASLEDVFIKFYERNE